MYFLLEGSGLEDSYIYKDDFINIQDSANLKLCKNEEELFIKLIDLNQKPSFYQVCLFLKNNNVHTNNDFLLKIYCSKSSGLRESAEEYMYILLSLSNKKSRKLKVITVCSKSELRIDDISGVNATIKVKKSQVPFYLLFLSNNFTMKDFYCSFKNITGFEPRYINTIELSSEVYLVTNNRKVVSFHKSLEGAKRVCKMIKAVNIGKRNYFNPKIEMVENIEELVSFTKRSPNTCKAVINSPVIDFDWLLEFSLNSPDERDNQSPVEIENDNSMLLIKSKNGELILKKTEIEMFKYIKDNKLYINDIFIVKNRLNKNHEQYLAQAYNQILQEIEKESYLYQYLNGKDNSIKVEIVSKVFDLIKEHGSVKSISFAVTSTEETDEISISFFNNDSNFFKFVTSLHHNLILLETGKICCKSIKQFIHRNKNNSMKYSKVDILESRLDAGINISHIFQERHREIKYFKALKDMDYIIDVDGYYKNGKASCGIVVRDCNNEIVFKISSKIDASTSVECEIKSTMLALKQLRVLTNFSNICIRYDCFSIIDYLVSYQSTDIGIEYQNMFKETVFNKEINIFFKHVKGHSFDTFNDMADCLASNFYNN